MKLSVHQCQLRFSRVAREERAPDSKTYHSKVLSRDATGEGYVVDVAVYCTLFAEQLGLAVVDVARGLLVEGGTPRPYRGRD